MLEVEYPDKFRRPTPTKDIFPRTPGLGNFRPKRSRGFILQELEIRDGKINFLERCVTDLQMEVFLATAKAQELYTELQKMKAAETERQKAEKEQQQPKKRRTC